MKMSAEEVTVVPPDGNWGWMIVVAYALNGICTVSLMQGFVLVFKDTFPLFGFNATESTVIINTNLAFGMILGLTNGPLLRTFGYRKMAVIGSILYSIGVFMTTFARSFTFLIISYGVFASLGTTITSSAFSYALNSYFTTKRGRAMSLALTIIGLGPIIVPQITTFLVSYYGFQGTILLYGAFSLHSLVGSLLLRPLKWYAKNVTNQTDTTNEIPSNNDKENKIIDEKTTLQDEGSSKDTDISDNLQKKRRVTISSIDHDAEIGSIYGFDISYIRQLSETPSEIDVYQSTEDCSRVAKERKIARLNNRFKSIETINLGSSVKIFEGKPSSVKYSNLNGYETNDSVKTNATENQTLLEENTLDNGTDNNEKTLSPFVGEWLHQPPRIMYMFSLCLLILSRTSLLFADGFVSLIIVAVGIGTAKGFRSVYMSLVIPSYVPIDRLPNASGIQMIVNGVILLSAGPMLGVMRDSIGSYTCSLITINSATALTVIMWSIEIVIVKRRNSKTKSEQQEHC
ncbi:uncharacterized protein LOC117608408 isoform X3 [Osmia lignaria lignaria]|uniref:uncharacterized protein LOC117608408 isoform X3 n=1 Tax=Osmia lignaria lignaria TaxID=1437193 RepID=UPI001478BBE4|nr:monocarboxylate transporter 9-like isoform X2 [Osmia lignaria]